MFVAQFGKFLCAVYLIGFSAHLCERWYMRTTNIYSGWLLVASDWIDSVVLRANLLILLHLKSGIKNQKCAHLILDNFSMGAHML